MLMFMIQSIVPALCVTNNVVAIGVQVKITPEHEAFCGYYNSEFKMIY